MMKTCLLNEADIKLYQSEKRLIGGRLFLEKDIGAQYVKLEAFIHPGQHSDAQPPIFYGLYFTSGDYDFRPRHWYWFVLAKSGQVQCIEEINILTVDDNIKLLMDRVVTNPPSEPRFFGLDDVLLVSSISLILGFVFCHIIRNIGRKI
jgi:hypothetical protein